MCDKLGLDRVFALHQPKRLTDGSSTCLVSSGFWKHTDTDLAAEQQSSIGSKVSMVPAMRSRFNVQSMLGWRQSKIVRRNIGTATLRSRTLLAMVLFLVQFDFQIEKLTSRRLRRTGSASEWMDRPVRSLSLIHI